MVFLGNVSSSINKLEHPEKEYGPIVDNFVDSNTPSNEEQFAKLLPELWSCEVVGDEMVDVWPISVTYSRLSKPVLSDPINLLHPLKALFPIDVIDLGKFMYFSDEQPLKKAGGNEVLASYP